MNNGSMFRGLLIAALIVGAAVLIANGAYNAGVAHGIAESGRAISPPAGGTPYVYVWPRPWGFGFFPVFPLFFLFFVFVALRAMWWGGRRGGPWSSYPHGIPPAFDEWHRRAHEAERRPPAAPESRS